MCNIKGFGSVLIRSVGEESHIFGNIEWLNKIGGGEIRKSPRKLISPLPQKQPQPIPTSKCVPGEGRGIFEYTPAGLLLFHLIPQTKSTIPYKSIVTKGNQTNKTKIHS